MNKLYFRYLASLYLKDFLILLFAMVLMFAFIDILVNHSKLNFNSNLFLLYFLFTCFNAIAYVLPICQILAFIWMKISLIKNNELIALYSLGLSKNQILFAAFLLSFFISLISICANFTSFAYAESYKNNILKNSYVESKRDDIFFKYKEDFFYIQRYENNQIFNVKIFSMKDEKIKKIIKAQSAEFKNKEWNFKNVNVIEFLDDAQLGKQAIKTNNYYEKITLDNFTPSILQNFGTSNISLKDAYFYLKNINKQSSVIRANIYKLSIFLLYAPFLSIILFYYLPSLARYEDLSIKGLVLTCASLLIYGGFFLLLRLATNDSLNPEIAILMPVMFIIVYSLILFIKNK